MGVDLFTGIIEEIGVVSRIENFGVSARILINAQKVLENTKIGESIAVNGVCLTVTDLKNTEFTADVMAETLRRTNLGTLSTKSKVNLERAMKADGRFGGHIVSGHIDGTGVISQFKDEGNSKWVYINAPSKILDLIVEKGSIAIDGISLTVAAVSKKDFAVSIIPHTKEETTLLGKKIGDSVNIENDIIAKYIQKFSVLKTNSLQEEKNEKILNWLSQDNF